MMRPPRTTAKAMTFLNTHSYREIKNLVEDLTPDEAGTFWEIIKDNWRTVAIRSGRGGRGTMMWTSLLRKMVLFERKAGQAENSVRLCDK